MKTELEKSRIIEKFMNLGMNNIYFEDSSLPYPTDWNWLMDALKKFDYLYEDKEESTAVSIINTFYEKRALIWDCLICYDIEATVNALCDGIEWCNSTLN